jgi:hypothetical protein|nr:hypothetical protein [uncultured Steroidobacter sp.]
MSDITCDLGNLADWLSALGTIAATSLALWLALRDGKDRVGFTVTADSQKLVVIVFNAGVRPVVIRAIEMALGRIKPVREQSIESILEGPVLPVVLRPGEDVRFERELSRYKSYLPDRLFQASEKKFRWNRQVYFVVTTGSDRRIRHKLRKADRENLVQKGE